MLINHGWTSIIFIASTRYVFSAEHSLLFRNAPSKEDLPSSQNIQVAPDFLIREPSSTPEPTPEPGEWDWLIGLGIATLITILIVLLVYCLASPISRKLESIRLRRTAGQGSGESPLDVTDVPGPRAPTWTRSDPDPPSSSVQQPSSEAAPRVILPPTVIDRPPTYDELSPATPPPTYVELTGPKWTIAVATNSELAVGAFPPQRNKNKNY